YMEKGFLIVGGRGVKQKKGRNEDGNASTSPSSSKARVSLIELPPFTIEEQTLENPVVTKEVNKEGIDVNKVGVSSSNVDESDLQASSPNMTGEEGNTSGSTSYTNLVHSVPTSRINGGVHVGNEPVLNKFPSSYATNKLSSMFLTKANLQKLKPNVPNDADYDVWLPLALVHEVNDKITNSLYRYFIRKRLAFPLWNGLCATIGKSMVSRK
nr:hypothetical protein [Tanacetum cinerariifolium]